MKTQSQHNTDYAHAPGPWSIETKGSRHFIDGEEGLTVCYLDRRGVREPSEVEANARLIAAAPELLDALKALMSRDLDHRLHGFPELEKARAAIVKAEGAQ